MWHIPWYWSENPEYLVLEKLILQLWCADVYLCVFSIIWNNLFRTGLSLHWLKSCFIFRDRQGFICKAKCTNLCWFCCLTDFILLQLVAEHFCLGWRRIRSWLRHTKLHWSPRCSSAAATRTAARSTRRPCSAGWCLSGTAASCSMWCWWWKTNPSRLIASFWPPPVTTSGMLQQQARGCLLELWHPDLLSLNLKSDP